MASPGKRGRSALWFLLVSVVAGCLVAGLAVPVLALAGVGSRAAQSELAEFPTKLTDTTQAQRSTLLAADGQVIGYFYDQNRTYVSLDKIAPVMRQAILAAEDNKFYSHGAIDLKSTIRAFLANLAHGSTVQGGSTLTQQYVKQVLVNDAELSDDQAAVREATDDSYQRKITELRYALSVEQHLTKNQILERYLNIAYFGDGAYGVQAAAEHYFGTTAAQLTLPEAALLAGLVQSPDGYDPVQHPQAALDRRDYVLSRMAELKMITAKAERAAQATGFDQAAVVGITSGCSASTYPFVCDYAERTLLQLPSLGSTIRQRQHTLDRGGLTIRTTIDVDAQNAAQQAIDKIISGTDPLIAVTDIVEPGTGKITALAQNRSEMGSGDGQTYYNYSASADLGGSTGFQPGSTFKAITAAAALEKGLPLSTRLDAPASRDYSGTKFSTCNGKSTIGKWTVDNSTGVNGNMNMIKAAEYSVNNYFVQLELDTGMCNVVKMADRLGVQSNTKGAPITSYDDKPSLTLGTAEVSPLSMAGAYATFAAGGIGCTPVIVDQINTPDGKNLTPPDAGCHRVISSGIADTVNDLLSHVIDTGTGTPARTADQRPEAGKTGTIDSNAAVWFNGYTPNAEAVSMISEDTSRKPFRSDKPASYRSNGLQDYTVPSTGVVLSGTGGGDAGHDLWRPTMNHYLKSLPVEKFDPAPQKLVGGADSGNGTNTLGNGTSTFGNGNGFNSGGGNHR
ncbi:penicillin-binding protein [Microlunatus elymi]|uniref:Penicillin-binding protein n=1 Tax=Microlunatus elymi TaxID=2596828 RepID=A0A516Q2Q5_9ACTN|nr:transglycosylase domain-containing protein [Microlunatus elymi]QDP97717.1 penicillin-binding protein [Microlunatus elymi]